MFAERSQLAFHTTIKIILNLAENKHTGKKKKDCFVIFIFNSTCFTFYSSSLKPSFTFKSKLSHLCVTLQNVFYWLNFHLCCHLQMSVNKTPPKQQGTKELSHAHFLCVINTPPEVLDWDRKAPGNRVFFVDSEAPCYCANPSSSVDHLEIFQRPQCENHASTKSFGPVLPISNLQQHLLRTSLQNGSVTAAQPVTTITSL